ncbi:GntR family transcriptional regulator [Amycolatopsis sp. K13G38]|uniref:GntR family transcriptional regulator n=1 Tax=Amycolatopsis acididurans TaxID=2724524 RepID=A0ABX1JD20_9PSEU|nr:GntR family transcriptional regulator [Amycolatopsis acididurans]NKQ56167.1 GntR family transcriptional regulator [Amycolatopsis acididurans]
MFSGVNGRPPKRHRKASDWVVGWLRDSIIAGRLQPGEQLKLVALADQAGLSTTPIREALSRLRDEGFVVGDSHRTFRVTALSHDEIRDYYLLHAFLSGVLAERAATALSKGNLAELRALDQEMRVRSDSHDASAVHELNFAFHRMINECGATDVMRRFVTVTTRLVSRRTYPEVEGWSHSIEDHAGILEALEARDGVKAREAMELHIQNVGQAVMDDLLSGGWDG